MLIQLNTDHNITGNAELAREVESILTSDMERFEKQITRLEVHLKDSNGPKKGPEDKRCQIEARLAGLRPVSVSHADATLSQAISGASEKLKHLLTSTLGELNHHPRRNPSAVEYSNSEETFERDEEI